MDEKRVAELRKFVSAISDAKISPFVDLKKFCNSGIYNLAVQMATEHAIKHGDFIYLNLIFGLLDGTTHFSEYISSLRPKVNFIITDDKPRRLKKATAEQVAKETKLVSITSVVKTSPPQTSKKKVEKNKASYDLMDSRLMLPGSYGSGKRR